MTSRGDTGLLFDSWASAIDGLAVVVGDRELGYRELDRLIDQRCQDFGHARRLILIESASELDPLVSYLAALRGRHVVMMVPPGSAVDGIIDAYQPDSTFRSAGDGWTLNQRVAEPEDDLHPDLAVLLSTSGSTGVSKFVRLSRANLASNAESIAEYLSIQPSDRALLSLPLHYCYGLSVLHSHLLKGAAVVISDLSVVDPCFWDAVAEHGVTTFPAVPFTFELLDRVDFASKDVPSLRYITQAGGKLAAEKVERYARLGQQKGFELFVMYGATEATARMAYLPPHLAPDYPQAIGQAIPGGRFDLADDGELLYSGPNVMMGYATSRADLAKGPEIEILSTGDLARTNEAGLFEIVGRKSRFLKMFGLRISLDAVEDFASSAERTAAATGTDDQLIVAVETGGATVELDAPTIGAQFGLPLSAVEVVAVDELPRLANGKVDYVSIRDRAGPSKPSIDHAGSAGDLIGHVLGQSSIGPDDTFVALGGDSLSYVEVSIGLEELLGHVPPAWHLMTIAELDGSRRTRGRLRAVETGVAIRAVAILAILAQHFDLVEVLGGAHVLLAAAGFNFSRFALNAIDRADSWRPLRSVIARVMIPTTVWVLLVFMLKQSFSPAIFFYASHLTTDAGGGYWFIELLVQMLVIAAVAFAVPKVRALHRVSPYVFAVAVLTASLYLRFGIDAVWNTDHLGLKVLHMSAWLFAIGWVAERSAARWQRLALSGVTLVTVPGFFDSTSRTLVILLGLLALVWIPTVRVPAPLNRVLGTIGGASLYLYLVHFQVNTVLGVDQPLVKMAIALVFGLIASVIGTRVLRVLVKT